MKITIIVEESEKEIKEAIARGWNNRYGEKLTGKDINSISNKEDILCAIPYLALSKITIKSQK